MGSGVFSLLAKRFCWPLRRAYPWPFEIRCGKDSRPRDRGRQAISAMSCCYFGLLLWRGVNTTLASTFLLAVGAAKLGRVGVAKFHEKLLMSRHAFADGPAVTRAARRSAFPIFVIPPIPRQRSPVLFRKQIRSQMYYGVTILIFTVLALSVSGLQGMLKFRELTKSIRQRANELPLTADLSRQVSDLRVSFSRIQAPESFAPFGHTVIHDSVSLPEFYFRLDDVENALNRYSHQLENSAANNLLITDNSEELQTVAHLREALNTIREETRRNEWRQEHWVYSDLNDRLVQFHDKVRLLPDFLRKRTEAFAEKARTEYHAWLLLSAVMTILAIVFVVLLVRRFRQRIFQPLDILVQGSRQVASGDFEHRIRVNFDDEMSELAEALNAMTSNFQTISKDLNHQVQERSREVVRSEQMASVGFLAAGVAHEINNPLASIAWSAESLETRLYDILNPTEDISEEQRTEEIADMKKYLQRIQEEAFRCKGITSSLLDFSRLGDCQKSRTDMADLIDGVVDMLRPLSRYREKTISVNCQRNVFAVVNAQEIKQVVLNLVTNALDSVERGGQVTIELEPKEDAVELRVLDNGCGMNDEVLRHLFEPFFTQRRDGQGTGLGLSITYRIIQEHGGTIHPYSEGLGRGSQFTITLPLASHDEKELKTAA